MTVYLLPLFSSPSFLTALHAPVSDHPSQGISTEQPVSGPQQVWTNAAGHTYQLRQLSNGRAD